MRSHRASIRNTTWLWAAALGSILLLGCSGGEDLADVERQSATAKAMPSYQALASVYVMAGYVSCATDAGGGCDDELSQWAYNKPCKTAGVCGRTCALRMSKAFKDAGYDIGTTAGSVDFQDKLRSKYRKADFTISPNWQALSSGALANVPWGRPGIIGFKGDRNGDYYGHIDLWTGENCLGNPGCYYWDNWKTINFWVLGESAPTVATPAPPSLESCQTDHGVFAGTCPNGPCVASWDGQVCGTLNCYDCDCSGGLTAKVKAGHVCSTDPAKNDQPAGIPVPPPTPVVPAATPSPTPVPATPSPAPSNSGTLNCSPKDSMEAPCFGQPCNSKDYCGDTLGCICPGNLLINQGCRCP